MATTILIALIVLAALGAFFTVDGVGKPRKPLAPRVAAFTVIIAALQISAYVYLLNGV